jgi:UDP-N-acetylglucosamine 3-dehydrogenase
VSSPTAAEPPLIPAVATVPAGRPLRIALLGTGGVTRRHARTLASLGGEAICFIASRERWRAEALNMRIGGGGAFGSYEDAIADERIDAVLVATPPAHHLELALAAAGAGKHVIVEKPPFLHASDFDAVEAVAERAGVRVLVAENYRYKPLLRMLRSVVASGEIGDVRYVKVNALKHQRVTGWRTDPALAGGGALFEGGIHWVHLMDNLGLTVASVQAYRPGQPEGPERSMLVVVQYEEGGVGTLHHSWDTPGLLRGLRLSRLHGTHGSVAFESNGIAAVVNGTRGRRVVVPGLRDISGYRAMFVDFIASLRSGREPLMTLARARRDLELVESAYRSLP